MHTISRRKRNKIFMLKNEDGEWLSDPDTLGNHVFYFYKYLFQSPTQWCNWEHSHVSFPALSSESITQLWKDIDTNEMRIILFSMKPWKASGPDGFLKGFY